MRNGMMIMMAVMLTGCASVADLERKEPTFTMHSSKSAQAYSACVTGKWVKIASTAHTIEVEEGFQVIVPSPVADTDELLIIRRVADGSMISLHERSKSLAVRDYRETAQSCL